MRTLRRAAAALVLVLLATGLAGAPTAPAAADPAPTPDEQYVDWLFGLFFGRPASPADRDYWVAELRGDLGPYWVAFDLRRSAEGTRYRDITLAYTTILDRLPDPASGEYWYDALRAGLPRWKVDANLIGSAELRTLAGGTDEDWVRRMFGLTLDRTASDADVAYFTGQLDAGVGRGTLTGRVINSPEGARAALEQIHLEILDRPPYRGEDFDQEVVSLRNWRDISIFEVALAISQEAYDRVTDA